MNGSCAGGTGAFIDQIATLLGCETPELNSLAARSTQIYPIASRCGVFARTDIQNLLSRNISRADIAASSFHAVAQQIVTTLARCRDIKPGLLFCGGPLAFIPMLRRACQEVMGIGEHDCIIPEHAQHIRNSRFYRRRQRAHSAVAVFLGNLFAVSRRFVQTHGLSCRHVAAPQRQIHQLRAPICQ